MVGAERYATQERTSGLLGLSAEEHRKSYALARPNARSSHVAPTPQGTGLAVVLATALATVIGLAFGAPGSDVAREAAIVLAASLILAATGAIDDLTPSRAACEAHAAGHRCCGRCPLRGFPPMHGFFLCC